MSMESTTQAPAREQGPVFLMREAATAGLRAELTLDQWRDIAEGVFVALVMEQCDGNQCKAARALHKHRNQLFRILQKHGLRPRAKGKQRG